MAKRGKKYAPVDNEGEVPVKYVCKARDLDLLLEGDLKAKFQRLFTQD